MSQSPIRFARSHTLSVADLFVQLTLTAHTLTFRDYITLTLTSTVNQFYVMQ